MEDHRGELPATRGILHAGALAERLQRQRAGRRVPHGPHQRPDQPRAGGPHRGLCERARKHRRGHGLRRGGRRSRAAGLRLRGRPRRGQEVGPPMRRALWVLPAPEPGNVRAATQSPDVVGLAEGHGRACRSLRRRQRRPPGRRGIRFPDLLGVRCQRHPERLWLAGVEPGYQRCWQEGAAWRARHLRHERRRLAGSADRRRSLAEVGPDVVVGVPVRHGRLHPRLCSASQ
mmetsp:Transcript_47123/g.135771  ORF Transcript_47123/g.135771 Transcript_47123/m.135771 type:complete len:231 (-) Transcript_47123:916-1608(-)